MRELQRAEINIRPSNPLVGRKARASARIRRRKLFPRPVKMRVQLMWYDPETQQHYALDNAWVLECPNRAALEYARAHLVASIKQLDGVIVVDPTETESCEESEI